MGDLDYFQALAALAEILRPNPILGYRIFEILHFLQCAQYFIGSRSSSLLFLLN
jgi:hypothetical protein